MPQLKLWHYSLTMGLNRLSNNSELQKKAYNEALVVVQSLTTLVQVQEAYLFGSVVGDSFTEDSDIDLVAVVSDGLDVNEIHKKFNRLVLKRTFALDLILKNKSEFDQRKEIGGVCFEAFYHGKKIL